MNRIVASAVLTLVLASPVQAQQRPLLTEDPETIGAGLILIEVGVDQLRGISYPASGLTGNLLRLPAVGVSFGVSSIAEIQVDGGLYNRLLVTERRAAPFSSVLNFSGDRTSDVEDFTVGAKVRLIAESTGGPSLGVRFATRLPNASNESGLGLDTSDFYASLLFGKTIQSVRFVANFGVGILGDPSEGTRQNDVLTYGLSVARAIATGVEVVGEINGRTQGRLSEPPIGTESRGGMRLGGRFTRGTVRLDGGLIIGMTSRDPSIGFTAGLTWVFRGFTVP
ncbi:MAG TPA: transporter [Vicinamibacterales bacterium]|nr:transporter [Vicinamibacterales bacterium]